MAVTWSPVDKSSVLTLSNDNLTVNNTTTAWGSVRATLGLSTGKWYYESRYDSGGALMVIGLATSLQPLNSFLGDDTGAGLALQINNGDSLYKRYAPQGGYILIDVPVAVGDVYMLAWDADTGKVWFGQNGAWLLDGDPVNGIKEVYHSVFGTFSPACSVYDVTASCTARFKSGDLSYPVPEGFLPWEPLPVGSISGTVYEKNSNGLYVPGAYPVRVYTRNEGVLVASTTSAEDGSYTISDLRITDLTGATIEYYVVALDSSAVWNTPAIVDKVFPS